MVEVRWMIACALFSSHFRNEYPVKANSTPMVNIDFPFPHKCSHEKSGTRKNSRDNDEETEETYQFGIPFRIESMVMELCQGDGGGCRSWMRLFDGSRGGGGAPVSSVRVSFICVGWSGRSAKMRQGTTPSNHPLRGLAVSYNELGGTGEEKSYLFDYGWHWEVVAVAVAAVVVVVVDGFAGRVAC